jgi:hypothetical protein
VSSGLEKRWGKPDEHDVFGMIVHTRVAQVEAFDIGRSGSLDGLCKAESLTQLSEFEAVPAYEAHFIRHGEVFDLVGRSRGQ